MRSWLVGMSASLLIAVAGCDAPDVSALPAPTSVATASVATPSASVVPERKPRCARQDCATKKIIDDGCITDSKGARQCASCMNMCP